jgi:hypothetical protein
MKVLEVGRSPDPITRLKTNEYRTPDDWRSFRFSTKEPATEFEITLDSLQVNED